MANLLMHCGGREVTRDGIADAPTPERTKTWVPVAHNRLLELAQSTIEAQGYSVTNEAHGLSGGGARYFGLMELANGHAEDDYSLVLGLRNSHDKTFPASLALGSQVLMCDNLSFFGEVVLTRRHTRFIERDLPGIVTQAVGRLSEMRTQQADRIDATRPRKSSFNVKANEKGQLAMSRKLALVEAAGIEPASRGVSMPASTRIVDDLSFTT